MHEKRGCIDFAFAIFIDETDNNTIAQWQAWTWLQTRIRHVVCGSVVWSIHILYESKQGQAASVGKQIRNNTTGYYCILLE